ncbi:MAG: hypothetical protein PHU46_11560 [Rhodocyclaceae bacterium]|nr:hypothetical protein [Rhodocyclaceae bacterium]
MNIESTEDPDVGVSTTGRRYCWLPTMDLRPGMVIARPITGTRGNRITLQLARGGVINVDTIAQLVIKGVECVAVYEDDPADRATESSTSERYQARLGEIFGQEPPTVCRGLYAALMAYGPCKC